jgi:hypothetical protein
VKHTSPVLIWLGLIAALALAGHDIGATDIFDPREERYGRGPFGINIVVVNFGTEAERNYPVRCWIDSCGVRIYEDSANAWGLLPPGRYHYINNFPSWHPTPGYYTCSVTAFTDLPADENRANDTVRSTCTLILAEYRPALMSYLLVYTRPVVDGVLDGRDDYGVESEISDTAGRAGEVRPRGSCLICMNHVRDTAYIAVDAIAAKTRDDQDRVLIKFDENHDGVWAQDFSEGTYTAFISGGIDSIVYSWLPGQQCPGCRLVTGTGSGNLQFEIAIPIGTRPSDLNINPGSDLSLAAISFWRGESCYGWWPQSLELAQWDDPQVYGKYGWNTMAVAERPLAGGSRPRATVVRSVLYVPLASGVEREASSVLLDISGRKVLDLKPGANDVRSLVPGVYFVRAVSGRLSAASCQKVIVTR